MKCWKCREWLDMKDSDGIAYPYGDIATKYAHAKCPEPEISSGEAYVRAEEHNRPAPVCSHCGNWRSDHEINSLICPSKDVAAFTFYEPVDTATEPSLQLLIIDAGECCFLKVEKGRLDTKIMPDDIGGMGFRIIGHPFDEVRAKIDSQEAEPPVPRAERLSDGYRIIWENAAYQPAEFQMWRDQFEVLEQLAGVTIPVYEPTKGTWHYISDATDRLAMDCGISIYRYTR